VTISTDAARPDGRVLQDTRGREIARFEQGQRDGRPTANQFSLSVAPEDAVAAVVAQLAGWSVAVDEPFGRLLVNAGGRPRRHAHVLSRDLASDPAPPEWLEPPIPPGLRLTPVDRPPTDLAPASFAAYPSDHPDYANIPSPDQPEIELDELMSGRLMGPLLPCSGLIVRDDGSVAGAILVNDSDGRPPDGGPWISQLFRHPQARGAGAPLLRRALAIATRDGVPAIGLAVTDGNPAKRLYECHGFAAILNVLTVEL
jgi:GNAT superfamily N-acetyltransferase